MGDNEGFAAIGGGRKQAPPNETRLDIQSIKTNFVDRDLLQLRQQVYLSPRPPGLEGKKQDDTVKILVMHALNGDYAAVNQKWQEARIYEHNKTSATQFAHDVNYRYRAEEHTNAIDAANRHDKNALNLHCRAAEEANQHLATGRASLYGADPVKEKKALDEETSKIVIAGTKDPQAREDAINAATIVFGAAVVMAALISLDRENPGNSYAATAFQTSKDVQKEILDRLKHLMAIETDATTLKKLHQSYDQLAAESKNAYESESAEKKRQTQKIDNVLGGDAYSLRNTMYWMSHLELYRPNKEWAPPRMA